MFVIVWLGFAIDLFVVFYLSPWTSGAVVVMVVLCYDYHFVTVIAIVFSSCNAVWLLSDAILD